MKEVIRFYQVMEVGGSVHKIFSVAKIRSSNKTKAVQQRLHTMAAMKA